MINYRIDSDNSDSKPSTSNPYRNITKRLGRDQNLDPNIYFYFFCCQKVVLK